MKRPILAALALLAAAPAAARTPAAPRAPGGWSQAPDDCPLTVAFTSIGTGTDQPTLARVERRLRSDRRVRSMTRFPWGREGEVTLCVIPVRSRHSAAIARDLRGMIPRRPRGTIYVTVYTPPPYQR